MKPTDPTLVTQAQGIARHIRRLYPTWTNAQVRAESLKLAALAKTRSQAGPPSQR